MRDGWAENPDAAFTSTSHAEIRHPHLFAGCATGTRRRNSRSDSWRSAGHGTLCANFNSGAGIHAPAATMAVDSGGWHLRASDTPSRLPPAVEKTLSRANLG